MSKRACASNSSDVVDQQSNPTKKRKSTRRRSTPIKSYFIGSQESNEDRNDEEFVPSDDENPQIQDDQESVNMEDHDTDDEELNEETDEEIMLEEEPNEKELIVKIDRKIIGDLGIDTSEKDEDIKIQKVFKMKDSYKNFLILDIGSSFSKGYALTKEKKTFKKSVLGFEGQSSPGFVKTTLYCCPITEEFALLPGELVDVTHPVEIASIKKLFTVLEAQTIQIGEKSFRVKQLMIEFIKCLLTAITTFPRTDGLIKKKMDCFIFTVPTGTPEHVKKHYKSCILTAIETNFSQTDHIGYDDIYVIEEYVLLFHADIDDNDNSVSMIVDIGHLTTDTTVISHDRKIVYANGEVGGVSVIHTALEKKGIDSFELMKELFSDKYRGEEDLPEKYKHLEDVIEEACRKITTPLLDVILQNRPKQIFIYGAFVSNSFFSKMIKTLLSINELQSYIQNHKFLLPEYRKYVHNFEVSCSETSDSSLVLGAISLIENAKKEEGEPLQFIRKIPASKVYPAFIFQDSNQNRFKIQIGKIHYELASVQQIEIFLLKIRNSIDIEKLLDANIDETNYQHAGIMEFERFSSIEIRFHERHTIIPCFALLGSVNREHLNLSIYYQRKSQHFYTHRFSIPRKGRMERIPVNEIVNIFLLEEVEKKSWYGTDYLIDLDIRGTNMNRIKKSEIPESELDENDFNRFTTDRENWLAKPITVTDVDESFKAFNEKCIACKQVADIWQRISVRRLCAFRKALGDNNIVPGGSCRDCFNKYRRFYKI